MKRIGHPVRVAGLSVAIACAASHVSAADARPTVAGRGTASRKDIRLGGFDGFRAPGALGVSDTFSPERDALLDEAIERCVTSMAGALVDAAPRLARPSGDGLPQ